MATLGSDVSMRADIMSQYSRFQNLQRRFLSSSGDQGPPHSSQPPALWHATHFVSPCELTVIMPSDFEATGGTRPPTHAAMPSDAESIDVVIDSLSPNGSMDSTNGACVIRTTRNSIDDDHRTVGQGRHGCSRVGDRRHTRASRAD